MPQKRALQINRSNRNMRGTRRRGVGLFMNRVSCLFVCGMTTCVLSCAKSAPSLSPMEAEANQKAAADREGVPARITNSIGMELLLIPSGRFVMGSPKHEAGRQPREVQHDVTLSRSFYMGRTEVTQAQWKAIMGDNPSFVEGDDHPVETIGWAKSVEFCRNLSEKEGVKYRLPTEAEWEYACRAGTTTPFHTGETISTDQANFDGQKTYGRGKQGVFRDESTEVASFVPNAWGLHDMHGNVWEWFADWFGDYPTDAVTDPTGPDQGTRKIVRGGCWFNAPAVSRSANRGDAEPVSWNFHFGFRVVREID